MAIVLIRQNDRKAFYHLDRADQQYQQESNAEGQVEIMLRRGGFHTILGEFGRARETLEAALTVAKRLGLPEHEIRARQWLSAVLASQGLFKEATALGTEAVDQAVAANLDTVAADGLIELATILLYQQPAVGMTAEAHHAHIEQLLLRAVDLAKRRQARLTVARAALQLASAKQVNNNPQAALEYAQGQLAFLSSNGYVRHEMDALLIVGRSYELLSRFDDARKTAEAVLTIARRIENRAQEAVALDSLAAQSAALGLLPQAEGYWRQSGEIRRQQNDRRILPYDLTNRAEALIRLGRSSEADPLLREVEDGIARKVEGFAARERRAVSLRVLQAATDGRWPDAISTTARLARDGRPLASDAAGRLAERLRTFAEAQARPGAARAEGPWMDQDMGDSVLGREQRYWELLAALTTRRAVDTLAHAQQTLDWKHVQISPEIEWRIAAVGAAAARDAGDAAQQAALATRARSALKRLEASWNEPVHDYLKRGDLALLMRKAGLV
jgi:tetratricopeptide (TPR) repeat protein